MIGPQLQAKTTEFGRDPIVLAQGRGAGGAALVREFAASVGPQGISAGRRGISTSNLMKKDLA